MKYIVLLGDGMADEPIPELDGRTPLAVANKPYMDYLAKNGISGMAKTVPDGMAPGSEVANLAMMGYDPVVYFRGRSPLEAASIGIELAADDVAMRCNLVTLYDAENFEEAVMCDHSSGDITTEEARELVVFVNENIIKDPGMHIYPGVSYRHCLVLNHTQTGNTLTPPHDIVERPIREYLPKGRHGELLTEIMRKSFYLLKDHPVNKARVARGLHPASCCWIWGEGTKPALSSFEEKYGIRGGVISAVDLVKGIGICAGLKIVNVEGATGTVDTNYTGKAEAALRLLKEDCDFVYIHVEGPDECGHHGDLKNKIRAIELIDEKILGPILAEMDRRKEPYAILLAPDHPTPIKVRTHTSTPIPFVLYRSDRPEKGIIDVYCEEEAQKTGFHVEQGYTLMDKLVSGKY